MGLELATPKEGPLCRKLTSCQFPTPPWNVGPAGAPPPLFCLLSFFIRPSVIRTPSLQFQNTWPGEKGAFDVSGEFVYSGVANILSMRFCF